MAPKPPICSALYLGMRSNFDPSIGPARLLYAFQAVIIGGLGSWLLIEVLVGEASAVPAQLIGLAVSATGMIVGSLLPQWVGHRLPHEPDHAALHHHAAAGTHHAATGHTPPPR